MDPRLRAPNAEVFADRVECWDNGQHVVKRQRPVLSSERLSCGSFVVLILAAAMTGTPATALPDTDGSGLAASNAPTAEMDLYEFKKTLTFEVNASQSKLFKIQNKIVRTSIADPSIAEPVVLAENILLLVGKATGETSLDIWDDEGNEVGINVIVEANGRSFAVSKSVPDHGNASSTVTKTTGGKLLLKGCVDPRSTNGSTNGEPLPVDLTASRVLDLMAAVQAAAPNVRSRPKGATAPFKPRQDMISWGDEVVIIDTGFKTGKTSKTIDLIELQSRTFLTEEKLAKVTTADPFIAEPVVVATHEIVVLGKRPGKTQFEIQVDNGSTEAFELKVHRRVGLLLSTITSFLDSLTRRFGIEKATRAVPPVVTEPIDFWEQETTDRIDMRLSQPKFFKTEHAIVRVSTADRDYAEVGLISTNELFLYGKKPGWTTICLWDDEGNVGKLDVHVSGHPAPERNTFVHANANLSTNPGGIQQSLSGEAGARSFRPATSPCSEVETWSGSKKDVLSVPRGDD